MFTSRASRLACAFFAQETRQLQEEQWASNGDQPEKVEHRNYGKPWRSKANGASEQHETNHEYGGYREQHNQVTQLAHCGIESHLTLELRGAAADRQACPLHAVVRCSFLNCLNTTLLEILKVIVHFFELVGGVTLPIRNLADDAKWISRTI